MYFLMIDGQVIFIELEGSAFNDLRSFNINAHSCDGDVLINLDVDLNAGYSGIDNIMYVVYCVDICWTLRKMFPIFQIQMFVIISFSLQLTFMI